MVQIARTLLGTVLQVDVDDDRTDHGAGIDRARIGVDVEPAREHADEGRLVRPRLQELTLTLPGRESAHALFLGGSPARSQRPLAKAAIARMANALRRKALMSGPQFVMDQFQPT